MTIEQALIEACGYETRIRDLYLDSAGKTENEEAAGFFKVMAKDEESHLLYLRSKLEQLKNIGKVDSAGLKARLSGPTAIEDGTASPVKGLGGPVPGGELEALQRALRAEEETSAYYRSLASTLDSETSGLFSRFVAIEEGHANIVRAELDLASRTGYWFEMKEFDLED